jgi:predicted dehydrogenase
MNAIKRREFLHTMGNATLLGAAAVVLPVLNAPAQPARIRVGQIGTGHAHAAGKMASLRKSAEYEVVGVVEPNAALRKRAEASKEYAGVTWMSEDRLLNTNGLQAVAVETEVKDLLGTAARCIAAGKHIHLDKPAGESLPAFKLILDDATRRKLTVQMGYMFRYNPAFEFCVKAVREGWLGEVFSIETVMSKALDAKSRQELLPYRGGSMFELGCHVIDSAVRILGKPDKVTAYPRHSAAHQDELADNMLAVLEYPRATVTVRSALLEVDGGARRQFVVCGEHGTVDIRPLEPPQMRVTFDRPRGSYKKGYQDVKLEHLPRYDADFADLAKVIRGEKAFEFTPQHDLAVQEAILRGSALM